MPETADDITHPPSVSPPDAAVIISSANLYYFSLEDQLKRLSLMSKPAPGESQYQTVVRQNCYYLSALCAVYHISGVPDPSSGKRQNSLLDIVCAYVVGTKDFPSVLPIFLTLWNEAGLSKQHEQYDKATDLWLSWWTGTGTYLTGSVFKGPDITRIPCYDHKNEVLYVLPLGLIGDSSPNWLLLLWFRKQPFLEELANSCGVTGNSFFAGRNLSSDAANAKTVTSSVTGVSQPSDSSAQDWISLATALTAAVGSSGGVEIVTPDKGNADLLFGAFRCVASVRALGLDGATSINDYVPPSAFKISDAQIPAQEVPANTPISINGSTVAVSVGPGSALWSFSGGDPEPADPEPESGPEPDSEPNFPLISQETPGREQQETNPLFSPNAVPSLPDGRK